MSSYHYIYVYIYICTLPVANVLLTDQLTKGKWYESHGEDSLYQDVVE